MPLRQSRENAQRRNIQPLELTLHSREDFLQLQPDVVAEKEDDEAPLGLQDVLRALEEPVTPRRIPRVWNAGEDMIGTVTPMSLEDVCYLHGIPLHDADTWVVESSQ